MRGAIAVAELELRDRKRLFLVAAALAIAPFVAGPIAGSGYGARTAIGASAGALAIGMAFAVAIGLGGSMVAREIADRRFTFHMMRPLSAAEIWVGKVLAGLFASVASFLIIAVPGWFAAPQGIRRELTTDATLPVVLFGIVTLFFVSHAISTMTRSRSPWLVLDFALLVVAVLWAYHSLRILFLGGAMNAFRNSVIGLCVIMLATLALGPIWQIAAGRADIRRSHRELSLVIWIVAAVALLAITGYVAWLTPSSLSQLRVEYLEQSPNGRMLVAGGTRRGGGDYNSAFLVNAASGAAIPSSARYDVAWSADGRVAAWTELTEYPRSVAGELVMSVDGSAPVATSVGPMSALSELALSGDGTRVAVIGRGNLAVHDVREGRLLASVPVAQDRVQHGVEHALTFVGPDRVRVYQQSSTNSLQPRLIEILELDVAKRTVTRTGQIEAPIATQISMSPDGSTMLVRASGVVADARTGEPVATLPIALRSPFASAILAGNRIAVVDSSSGTPVLHLFTHAGEAVAEIQLPQVDRAWITAQTSDGKLLLMGRSIHAGRTDRGMLVVDPTSGELERFMPGVMGPVARPIRETRLQTFAADAWLAGIDEDRQIVLWKPTTGERRKLPTADS